jgi:peptide methionine sulfoxide reductase MsrB
MKPNETANSHMGHLFDQTSMDHTQKYSANQVPEQRKILDEKYKIIKTIGEGRYAK